jgi:hypothetical protein
MKDYNLRSSDVNDTDSSKHYRVPLIDVVTEGDETFTDNFVNEEFECLAAPLLEVTGIVATPARQRLPYELFLYYFCDGIQEDLPSTALFMVLNYDFNLEPSDYSLLSGFTCLPWVLWPAVGCLSDTHRIAEKHRTPYVFIGIVSNRLGCLLLSCYPFIPSKTCYLSVRFINSLAIVVSEKAVE